MQQVRRGRRIRLICFVGPWFTGVRQDAVVRKAGVCNLGHIALGHVAIDAVIGRRGFLPRLRRKSAGLARMAVHALGIEICGRLLFAGLYMGIVAGGATQLSGSRAKALAHRHFEIVLHVIGLVWIAVLERKHKNRQGVIQRRARAKVLVAFSGLEHTAVTTLMARHAYVVLQASTEPIRVHDLRVARCGVRRALGLDMRFAGTMAVFAADRNLLKRLAFELAGS